MEIITFKRVRLVLAVSVVASLTACMGDDSMPLDASGANGSSDGELRVVPDSELNQDSNNVSSFMSGISKVTAAVTGQGSVVSTSGYLSCPTTRCGVYYYKANAILRLTANPKPGHQFVGWKGACNSAELVCPINVLNNANVEAIFKPINTSSGSLTAKLVLMNTVTGQPISAFDPLLDGATIDLNSLPEGALTIAATETAGQVQSMRFGLNQNQNYRTENVVPYALESDAGIEKLNPWRLGLGQHTISVTPFSSDNAGGTQGEKNTVSINVVRSSIKANTSSITINNRLGAGESSVKRLTLSNSGNIAGTFKITNVPNWVRVSPRSGDVASNGSANVSIKTVACTSTGQAAANLSLDVGTAKKETIRLVLNCGDAVTVTPNPTPSPTPNPTPSPVPNPQPETPPSTGSATFDYSLDRVYFNQAVPSLDTRLALKDQIPVVVNREGIIRAFVTANNTQAPVPQVALYWKDANGQSGKVDLTGPGSMRTTLNEATYNHTFNAKLPASFFKAGREYYVAIDSNNTIAETNEQNNRYPTNNAYASLKSVTPPVHRVTFVPVSLNGNAPNLTRDVVDRLYSATKNMHPIGESDVQVRSQVYAYNNAASGSGWSDLLRQMANLARADGSNRYYHAIVSGRVNNSSTAGIGYVPGKFAVSMMFPDTIAHEFGHNFSLSHVPCGVSGDPYYPHAGGNTNVYGYDILNNQLKAPTRKDFMSYCNNVWVSDYSFEKALNFRGDARTARYERFDPNQVPTVQPTLVVNGFVGNEEFIVEHMNQATVMSKQNVAGEFIMRGYDAMGRELFKQPFDVQTLSHSDDRTFSVAIPNTGYENLVSKLTVTTATSSDVLFEKTRSNIAQSVDLTSAAKAVRVGDNVKVTWDTLVFDQATIVDASTGNVLAFDSTGEVLVSTQANSLDLTLTSEFDSSSINLEID